MPEGLLSTAMLVPIGTGFLTWLYLFRKDYSGGDSAIGAVFPIIIGLMATFIAWATEIKYGLASIPILILLAFGLALVTRITMRRWFRNDL